MNCPVCGAENEESAAFCYRCGSALKSATGPGTAATGTRPERATEDLYRERREDPAPNILGSATSEPGSSGARVYQVPSGNMPPYVVGPAPTMSQTSNLALFSLILGILSFVFLPFIGAIGAVITGHMARREVRGSGGRLTGDGMATAGMVLGYLNIALSVLGLVVVCLFPLLFLGISATP